ncbi:MAG TPA: hypothetical protein VGJ73_00605, partial [Verrucomicrobiae bacterium]
TETHTNCLAAPGESVVTDEDGNSAVWFVNSDQATKTNVQTGLRENDWVEITSSGLKAGDPVVTVGAYGLPDKIQIQILNQTNDATAPNSSR